MPLTLGIEGSAVSSLVPGVQYLDPVIGYATTPDNPLWAVSGNFVLTARAVLPAATGANRFLACQWTQTGSADQSWLWFITTAGIMQFTLRPPSITPQTTADILTAAQVNAFGAGPVYIGVRCQASTGRIVALTSTNGIVWTETGTPVAATAWTSTINSTAPMHIGSRSTTGTDKFNQPIYWVEMRTGLDPGAGSLRFRFDASEASGTSWTDPRGIPWSLSAAGAIHS
jgi:hypothetical protein